MELHDDCLPPDEYFEKTPQIGEAKLPWEPTSLSYARVARCRSAEGSLTAASTLARNAISEADSLIDHLGQWCDKVANLASTDLLDEAKGSASYNVLIGKAHPRRPDDVAKKVREMTLGVEVPIGNDGQGMQIASMDSLRTQGPLASFCNASGSAKALDRRLLSQRGTTFVTRSMMMSRTFSKEKPQEAAAELHKLFKSGKFNMTINQCYPLAEAAQGHRDLEAQKTTGSNVIVP